MTHKFKAGDRVIVLSPHRKIEFDHVYKNIDTHNTDVNKYPFVVGDEFITECGCLNTGMPNPAILPATAENVKAINWLFPSANLTVPKTPNDVVRDMLARGDKYINAYVSETSYDDARSSERFAVIPASKNRNLLRHFCDIVGNTWMYVVPIDPKTGQEILEVWDTSNDS